MCTVKLLIDTITAYVHLVFTTEHVLVALNRVKFTIIVLVNSPWRT